MVITGVAEVAPERLAALVYVDAFYPSHGESALDQMPAAFKTLLRQRAETRATGGASRRTTDCWMSGVSTIPTSGSGSVPADRLVLELLHIATAGPLMRRAEIPRRYVAADADEYPAKAAFGPIADKAAADGCAIHRLSTGHDIMLEAPNVLADVCWRSPHNFYIDLSNC